MSRSKLPSNWLTISRPARRFTMFIRTLRQYFPLRRVFSPLHYHPLAECTSPCQVSLGLMVDKVSWGGTQASHAHSLPPFIAFPTPPAQTRKCIIKRSRQSVNAKAVQHLPRPFVRQPVGEGADRSAAHMDPTTEWVCREVLGSNCMSGWRYGRIRWDWKFVRQGEVTGGFPEILHRSDRAIWDPSCCRMEKKKYTLG